MKKILFLFFPLLCSIFLFHYFLVGQAVYGDGIYYWSYTRSFYMDHDLKLNDEISHHYDHFHNNTLGRDILPSENRERVALEYHLPVGPSIGYLPFFSIGDILARIAHIYNPSIVLNGYSDIYQITVGIGNILYVLIGLYFVFLLLKNYFSSHIALMTTIILFATTNLLYYGSIDVINSHPFAFFLSSIFFLYYYTKFSYRWYQWILVGIFIGLLILTRTQEVVFGIFLLASLVTYWRLKGTISAFVCGILCLLGVCAALLPQFILLQVIYHGILHSPYILSGGFTFLTPHLLGVLVNNKTGLLFTSPSIILGFFGLLLLAKKKKSPGILGVIFFLLEYYLIASWSFWDQAASYGIRMLITTFPIVAIGLGYIMKIIDERFSHKVLYMLGAVLFLFNVFMIVRFHVLVKNVTYDVTSVTRIDAQKKLNQLLHTHLQFFKQ